MINSEYALTSANLMRTLPDVLRNDEHMNGLAQMIADELEIMSGNADLPRIYARIDELNADLLDILAKDFAIDWYDYDYSVELKRETFKRSFYVRRHLGTRSAIVTALSAAFPNTSLQEWFEYGGDPFYFRVLLEATHQQIPIIFDDILNIIDLFKPARCLMEDGMVIVRVTCDIVIETSRGGQYFSSRVCGTFPRWGTHGDISHEDIEITSQSEQRPFSSPVTGQAVTGSYPRVGTHGDIGGGNLALSVSAGGVAYSPRPCGTSNNSLF